jgi:purine-nucleoside phosphorylase
MTGDSFDKTILYVEAMLPVHLRRPQVGIICGSGLSGLADVIKEAIYIPYSDLHGFATSTVPGHTSSLAFGLIGSLPVVVMLGRVSGTKSSCSVSK